MDAALEGLVCDGPDHGAQRSWVLRDDWVRPPAGPRGAQAATELARRYLEGHGPASAEDFATWSGLPLGVARTAFRALGGAVGELSWRGTTLAHLGARPRAGAPTGTLLLPAFDAYLLGYRRRPHTLPADTPWPVIVGGVVRALMLRDGVTVGTWAPRRQGQRVRVVLQPFEPGEGPGGPDKRLPALVEDLSRYLGRPVPVEFGEPG